MIDAQIDESRESAQIVIRPNRSMSWEGNVAFLSSISVVCLGIASVFALQGLWPVLPFAGAEVLALAAALYFCSWRLERCEVISVREQLVEVVSGRRRPESRVSFSRPWARVELRARRQGWYPSKLIIRSHGKELELGAFLGEEEKVELARQLRELLIRS